MSEITPAAAVAPVAEVVATPTTPAAAPVAPAAPAKDPWADFKPPEGFTMDSLKATVEFAQKNGMDPKAAAALAVRDRDAVAAASAKEAEDFKQLSEKGWLDELTADPELGGAKIRETMVDVMRGHDKLGPKTQAMIKDQGILYNPVLVRVLHDIGIKSKEDSFVRPGTSPGAQSQMSQEQRLQSMFTSPTK